ncbi:unnamed protein product [Phytomonas sp. Hart1]|nr:unnamed protein product [Phytomonas sp. Hart1]|eukprot:CCW69533.1 unnamed protein product [Phytomonas sp. isolate Hart1]
MLTEEEKRLYYAVQKAQLNRNTATKILEWYPINGKQLIAGSFIRVLIKLPLDYQPENYAIACVKGTIEGQRYSGFSTDSRQETNIYILAALPRTLAEVNGTQFQLNTVSNSRMNPDEFSVWLQLSRDEGATLPSITDLNVTAERLRACEIAHRSRVGLRPMQIHGNTHMNINPNHHSIFLQQNNNHRNELTSEHLQSILSNAQRQSMILHQQQYGRSYLASNAGTSLSLPTTSQSVNLMTDLCSLNSIAMGGHDVGAPRSPAHRGSVVASGHESSPRAHADGGICHNGLSGQADASHIADLTSLVPSSHLAASIHAIPPVVCGGQSYSPLQLTTLQTNTTSQEENEDTALERALRQGIMNNLQQTCSLFPKVTSRYKLSQLRLVERDMIEYLQQVREEISSKQENCVVCMDHVPTVILLPCRHKVMCRLCAPSCGNCPVCRSIIKEMFETTEI